MRLSDITRYSGLSSCVIFFFREKWQIQRQTEKFKETLTLLSRPWEQTSLAGHSPILISSHHWGGVQAWEACPPRGFTVIRLSAGLISKGTLITGTWRACLAFLLFLSCTIYHPEVSLCVLLWLTCRPELKVLICYLYPFIFFQKQNEKKLGGLREWKGSGSQEIVKCVEASRHAILPNFLLNPSPGSGLIPTTTEVS